MAFLLCHRIQKPESISPTMAFQDTDSKDCLNERANSDFSRVSDSILYTEIYSKTNFLGGLGVYPSQAAEEERTHRKVTRSTPSTFSHLMPPLVPSARPSSLPATASIIGTPSLAAGGLRAAPPQDWERTDWQAGNELDELARDKSR